MISILVSGTLVNKPSSRVSRNNNSYVTGQLRAAAGDESFLVSLVAFDDQICNALLALDKGDTVSVTGSAKPTTWAGRDGEPCLGLSVKVDLLLTQYALTKKRAAAQGGKARYSLPAQSPLALVDEDADGAPF
jgi:single-stranded DNA-binding protein